MKLAKLALPIMLAFAFVVLMGATVTMAAPADPTVYQAAALVDSGTTSMAWFYVPTTTLTINTDAYLDFVFQYANLIIGAMLMLAGIKAGFSFGFRILNQIGTIFGG